MHAVAGAGRLVAGRYRLHRAIGRGAMGIVWRGRDELLDRDVAVKEVQVTSAATPADTETIYRRTLREARTAARLSHPSVVTVFDVVEEDGSPWIVMELVRARSLDRLIAEDGPLPPAQAARVGEGLLGALATAHAAGVLHRDVKPSNVLVSTGRPDRADRLRHRDLRGRSWPDSGRHGRRAPPASPRRSACAASRRLLPPTSGRWALPCTRPWRAAARSTGRAARWSSWTASSTRPRPGRHRRARSHR